MYTRWKRKQTKEVNNGDYKMIFDQSLDDELLADDLVLASRMDSYLLIIINQINDPECQEIQRNQQNYLYTSFSEFMTELINLEKKEGKGVVTMPALEMTAIMMDPNQSY
ncbi:hypothetical protein JH06_2850 [Blastocystis sp. subtype 4]|uniref:hypothetical protein n=1 Tax=Blastocystis sp. subtype 4 TaxID=944170 RepID=UPI000711FFB1|nr:hypothetical protein JH06_2850 [Blastocystis sp. subtype 4]KNB44588.1 hypothetical protein JH06_2850 [Blastocystis sp. subtype 4]|eukprot:XP_014528031.1 hypothetical protein JH06_2850 [Blastocystis sp. subtype 4]